MSLIAMQGGLMGAGGGAPPAGGEVFPDAFSQSSVFSGVTAATTANMKDANNTGSSTTGSATDASALDWIKADLGAAAMVNRVTVGGGSLAGWGGIATYLNGATIQSSPDDSTWSNAAFVQGVIDTAGVNRDLEVLLPDPVSARYWRVARPGYVATATFRLHDDLVSKATGITYTQSSVFGSLSGSEANLNETPAVTTTGAATNNDSPAFIRADLGTARAVAYVVIGGGDLPGWGGSVSYLRGQQVQSSDDGSTWTNRGVIPTWLTDSGASAEVAIPVNTTARYWQVSKSGFLSMSSFRFYCTD